MYKCGSVDIKQVSQVKDLGVILTNDLKFRTHYEAICKKAHRTCALIFRSFEYKDPWFLISLLNLYVRPYLDYCSQSWSPYMRGDINRIERVLRAFTRRIPVLRNLSYPERLEFLRITLLENRRIYCDLVFLYKILHGLSPIYMTELGLSVFSGEHALRDKGYCLRMQVAECSLTMFGFANRSIKMWNCLPRSIIGMSLSQFKKHVRKLDFSSVGHL